jgi:hypothetical protein
MHIGHFPAQFSDERGGSPEAEEDEAPENLARPAFRLQGTSAEANKAKCRN